MTITDPELITGPEPLLRSAYRAFDARDIDAALELMHPEVDWPNAWEGGRVVDHAALRDYTGELISESTVRHSYQLRYGIHSSVAQSDASSAQTTLSR